MATKLTWQDTYDIAEALADAHEEIDPQHIRYTDLHRWICELPDFGDDPNASNERILEAIQMAWIDEVG
ncbi:MAG: Fe-S cluster assembly protein IscX [Proteobacteria bacterium]|nr:Fe-S cluster assembly protein IscX [Pseudomonadota bacterium]MCL2307467.1 Fe-S cluster assembly protein IscX [Pseudomonadota bacterium]